MDSPESVALAIENALSRSRREVYLGLPERLFGLINSILPGVIDRALRKQLPVIRKYALRKPGGPGRTVNESVKMEVLGVER